MVLCIILRKNETVKYKKIKDSVDSFEFEDGKYFIRKDKIFLKKKPLSRNYIPMLLYLEGISEPLGFTNLKKMDEDDQTILIDAKSIHSITSENILSVLSASGFSKADKLLLLFIVFGWVLTIASMVI